MVIENLILLVSEPLGFVSCFSMVAQMVKNLPAMWETRFGPWDGKIPWRRNGCLLQFSCLENPTDRGAWQGYSPWCHKELNTIERLTHFQYPYDKFYHSV